MVRFLNKKKAQREKGRKGGKLTFWEPPVGLAHTGLFSLHSSLLRKRK